MRKLKPKKTKNSWSPRSQSNEWKDSIVILSESHERYVRLWDGAWGPIVFVVLLSLDVRLDMRRRPCTVSRVSFVGVGCGGYANYKS